jgi:hypothetical protein
MTNRAKETRQIASEVVDLTLAIRLFDMADMLDRGIDIPRARLREAYARACMYHGRRSDAAKAAWRELNNDVHNELRKAFR